jgi:sulfatase-like protein
MRRCTMAVGYRAMTAGSSAAPRWILHPTLLAAAFVLEVVLANQVEPPGFVRSLAVAGGGATLLNLAAWGATRDRWLGGLIATGLILAMLSLGPLGAAFQLGRDLLGPSGAIGLFGLAVVVALAVPAYVGVRARRGGALLRRQATSVLNQFSALLVAVVLLVHVVPGVPDALADLTRTKPTVAVNPPDGQLPDIYMILMDGYPRTDILSSRLGIDNSAFLGQLGGLGFEVAPASRSNYTFTQVTLASMFQMRHIEQMAALAPLMGTGGAHLKALRHAMTGGPVWAALHAAGYEVVVSLPGYEHVALRSVADRVLDHGELTDVERDLLARTWLLDLVTPAVPEIFAGPQHDRILHGFDDLERLAGESRSKPIFTWMHVPAPHLPLVVDRSGGTLPLEPRRFDPPTVEGFGMTDAQLHAAYGDELSYLDQRLMSAVHTIQASATDRRPDPVIVIFSDHGYYYDPADLPARFGSFLAASTPGAPGLLSGSPTPVNLFPLLLNRYLGTDFPTSEDRFFVSKGTQALLDLTEVSDSQTGGSP